jgi:low affinity Fe/Cu permease
MPKRAIQRGLTQLGVMSGHPIAFVIVGIYAVSWVAFDRESLDFHGAATLATWLMTLFIQRAEHRDTQALQAKLDELLRAHGDANSELTHLDDKTAEEIEQHRDQASRDDPR